MPSTALDASTDFGRHVVERLRDETLIWLTTIGRTSGRPLPSVVWFLWNDWTDTEILVLSEPDKPKLHNIDANPAVALNLQAGACGDDVAVVSGAAVYDRNGPTEREWEAYAAKYADDIARIGFAGPDAFREAFSELIRITPEKVRGFV